MDDGEIVKLYWQRDEQAITETDKAHGGKLYGLSFRIVGIREDAEESVSDTYMRAWTSIPPQRPTYLFAYLAKICRCLCFDRLDRLNAAKRKADVVTLTAEMESVIPDRSQERDMEDRELGQLLSRFLRTLPEESMVIFMRRYWYMDSIQEIAARCGVGESKVKTQLFRTRNKLRSFLEMEGITV